MSFKCKVCGCEKSLEIKRIVPPDMKEVSTDKIILINNYAFDSRTVFRACFDCKTVSIDIEAISTSQDSTEEDKEKVKKMAEMISKKEVKND